MTEDEIYRHFISPEGQARQAEWNQWEKEFFRYMTEPPSGVPPEPPRPGEAPGAGAARGAEYHQTRWEHTNPDWSNRWSPFADWERDEAAGKGWWHSFGMMFPRSMSAITNYAIQNTAEPLIQAGITYGLNTAWEKLDPYHDKKKQEEFHKAYQTRQQHYGKLGMTMTPQWAYYGGQLLTTPTNKWHGKRRHKSVQLFQQQ